MAIVDWTSDELDEVGTLILVEVMKREGILSDSAGIDARSREKMERSHVLLSSALDKLPWDANNARKIIERHWTR
jgi:hypothetical protein